MFGDCLLLGSDPDAWPHPLHAIDNYPILRLQPIANHAQTVDHWPYVHLTVLHGVLVIDHKGEALCLIAANGLVWNQQGLVPAAPR